MAMDIYITLVLKQRGEHELNRVYRKALIQMLELASGDNVTAIALPAIGAGLGGLKWDDVKAIIETVSNDYPNVDLYVVETYQSE